MGKIYKYWNRDLFAKILMRQAEDMNFLSYEKDFLLAAVYDKRWNPMEEFNGCTLVQDDFHPSVSCFLHDYEWIVFNPSTESNKRFYKNLRRSGMKRAKARRWYIGVTLGIPFYKLKRKFK